MPNLRRHALVVAAALAATAAAAAPASAVVVPEDQVVQGWQCVGPECQTGRPALSLQVATRDTPALRLQQTGTGGFTAQTWDVAGNEANFFVRDLTAGSRLPFRIMPGAPTDTLTAGPGGVGIGVRTASAPLHVQRTTGAQLRVENTDPNLGASVLADLVSSGAPLLRFSDTSSGGQSWIAGPGGGGAFLLRDAADGSPAALRLTAAGTATARGVLQQDASLLADPQAVDAAALLTAVQRLDLRTWTTIGDASGARHLGPAGSAFRTSFGLGGSDDAIAPADLAGVALVAVQELTRRNKALEQQVATISMTPGPQGAPGSQGAPAAADTAMAAKVTTLQRDNAKKAKTIRRLTKQQRTTARQLAALKRQVAAMARTR